MRKQVSQKTLANTRKTPQPLKLRGFFIGGAGRALVEPFAQGLLKQFRFTLFASFPVSTNVVVDQQFVVK